MHYTKTIVWNKVPADIVLKIQRFFLMSLNTGRQWLPLLQFPPLHCHGTHGPPDAQKPSPAEPSRPIMCIAGEQDNMAYLQERIESPALVWRKALHQAANFGGQIWLELEVHNLEVVQQLLGERFDVCLIHQSIHQLQRPPPAHQAYHESKGIHKTGRPSFSSIPRCSVTAQVPHQDKLPAINSTRYGKTAQHCPLGIHRPILCRTLHTPQTSSSQVLPIRTSNISNVAAVPPSGYPPFIPNQLHPSHKWCQQ